MLGLFCYLRVKEKKQVLVFFSLLIFTASTLNAQDFKSQKEQADFMQSRIDSVAIGKAVPDFILYTADGDSLLLSDLKGKTIVVYIWATWCKPCIALSPDFENAKEEYESESMTFISISIDNTNEKWLNYVQEHKVKYQRFWINPGMNKPIRWFTFDEFEFEGRKVWGSSIPKLVIIDEKGVVENLDLGKPGTPEFKKAIKRALKN